jgi:hypothetical protein
MLFHLVFIAMLLERMSTRYCRHCYCLYFIHDKAETPKSQGAYPGLYSFQAAEFDLDLDFLLSESYKVITE